MARLSSIGIVIALAATAAPAAVAPSLHSGSVVEAAQGLKPGEYLWAPDIAPSGPVLLVVSLSTQRAIIYRNGVPIGITTVSTGRPGYDTPTGVFVILQKHVEHYSNIYDNAPMPYMQRLTWGGIALHAGNLPGHPASHGCIRLPFEFARLLYQVTHRGMTVIVTDRREIPRVAPADELLAGAAAGPGTAPTKHWNPGRSGDGPMSVIISAADQRLVVLRNGMVIGSSAVEVDGAMKQTMAYILNGVVDGKRSWVRIGLPGQIPDRSQALRGRIRLSEGFRQLLDSVLVIGTTVVVTGDSLRAGQAGQSLTIIENEDQTPFRDR